MSIEVGQVYFTIYDSIVRIFWPVDGDSSRWYVETYESGSWFYDEAQIEPEDLISRLEEWE